MGKKNGITNQGRLTTVGEKGNDESYACSTKKLKACSTKKLKAFSDKHVLFGQATPLLLCSQSTNSKQIFDRTDP